MVTLATENNNIDDHGAVLIKQFSIQKKEMGTLTGHTAVASMPPAIHPAASGNILFLYFFPPPSSDISLSYIC